MHTVATSLSHRLHRVVDREAGIDLATGGVEVERDVAFALGVEHEELGAYALGERAVDRAREHHAALRQELAADFVLEAGAGFGYVQLHGCRS